MPPIEQLLDQSDKEDTMAEMVNQKQEYETVSDKLEMDQIEL